MRRRVRLLGRRPGGGPRDAHGRRRRRARRLVGIAHERGTGHRPGMDAAGVLHMRPRVGVSALRDVHRGVRERRRRLCARVRAGERPASSPTAGAGRDRRGGHDTAVAAARAREGHRAHRRGDRRARRVQTVREREDGTRESRVQRGRIFRE